MTALDKSSQAIGRYLVRAYISEATHMISIIFAVTNRGDRHVKKSN